MKTNLNYIGDFLKKEDFNPALRFFNTGIENVPTPYFKRHIKELFLLDELMEFLQGYIWNNEKYVMNIEYKNALLGLVIERGEDNVFIQHTDDEWWVDIHKDDEDTAYTAEDEKEIFAILVLNFFN